MPRDGVGDLALSQTASLADLQQHCSALATHPSAYFSVPLLHSSVIVRGAIVDQLPVTPRTETDGFAALRQQR